MRSLEEHVLGAGEADADGAERHGDARLFGRVGVGADGEPGRLRTPLHELGEALEFFRRLGGFVAVDQTGDDFGGRGRNLARVNGAGRAVDGEIVALGELLAAD